MNRSLPYKSQLEFILMEELRARGLPGCEVRISDDGKWAEYRVANSEPVLQELTPAGKRFLRNGLAGHFLRGKNPFVSGARRPKRRIPHQRGMDDEKATR